jgi:hypothetical protein
LTSSRWTCCKEATSLRPIQRRDHRTASNGSIGRGLEDARERSANAASTSCGRLNTQPVSDGALRSLPVVDVRSLGLDCVLDRAAEIWRCSRFLFGDLRRPELRCGWRQPNVRAGQPFVLCFHRSAPRASLPVASVGPSQAGAGRTRSDTRDRRGGFHRLGGVPPSHRERSRASLRGQAHLRRQPRLLALDLQQPELYVPSDRLLRRPEHARPHADRENRSSHAPCREVHAAACR